MQILPYTDWYFRIRKCLQVEERVEVLLSLIQNLNVFAWNLYEVPMVDLTFITHRLNVDPLIKPKKTKTKEIGKTTRGSSEGGNEEIKASKGHQRGVFRRMVI